MQTKFNTSKQYVKIFRNPNQDILKSFKDNRLSKLSFTTPMLYKELTGNHLLGLTLNQCIFWSDKSKCKDGWFYKCYDEWEKELSLCERTIRRHLKKLEQRGFISTKIKKQHGLNLKHIFVHHERIHDSISEMLYKDCPNRTLWKDTQNSENNIQKDQELSCTKIAPTGHLVRFEPDTLSDSSIYTEENNQMTTTCSAPSGAVVVNSSLSEKEMTQLKNVYEEKPFKTENIETLMDFFNCALFCLINRPEFITRNQRLSGICKFVKNGTFEENPEWGKQQKSRKNREKGVISINQIEKQMNERAERELVLVKSEKKGRGCLQEKLRQLKEELNAQENNKRGLQKTAIQSRP